MNAKNSHSPLWKGRFEKSPSEKAVAFETSIHIDSRMVFDDIAGSIAHVTMLGKQGILSADESTLLCTELKNIQSDLQSGHLVIDQTAEDIHSFIEGTLTDRLGDIGKKVHAGRSRNDQIALDERLYLYHAIPALQNALQNLLRVLIDLAQIHTETLMPGYTHLQRAQPVTLAHHLCAWAQMLLRDKKRLEDAMKRVDECPLGAGALAGSGLPLDREFVAQLLGFSKVTQNSLDTVCDRDYFLEIGSACAILMTHLSRFCEEIIIWATEEFKFIELSEQWSTGSSIMPQKKNPDFAELIRGRTGGVYGNLIALFTMMKGLPLSYNRDMQEDKTSFFACYDTTLSCVEIFSEMIATITWNTSRMEAACTGGYLNATDLADYLVKKGLPFRTAHEVSASTVRYAIEKKCNIEDLSLKDMQSFSPLIENDIYEKLTPKACIMARNFTGGPNPNQVKKQIQWLQNQIVEDKDS
ncbi:MAG: argininosuccinate lyase [Treponemataceae bacterium]